MECGNKMNAYPPIKQNQWIGHVSLAQIPGISPICHNSLNSHGHIEAGGIADRSEVLEELPYGVVAGIGDRERLQAQLPLRLQRRELARFLFHIGIDQTSDA